MSEIEKYFKCPYCFEKISMLLDCSQDGLQSYIEDCEVCCHAIELTYEYRQDKVYHFSAKKAYT